MNNKKKIHRNLFLGIGSQVLTILLGIIVPRLTLTNYGSEVNGLLNSVTQIYTYVGLLEAGIGVATVQALYKTIGEKSRDKTNAVLSATNKYYHRTGILYLVAILAFSVIYPLVIRSDIPLITIILVIVFNGLGSVINYFFQGKYFLLLQAEGKNYIQTAVSMFTNVFKNVATIVLISLGFDVVFVQMIAMVVSLIQMIYITWYIKRNYSWIDLSVTPDFSSISQSKNVLVHQIGGLIFNSTDTIVLSVVCGLKVTSVYALYALLYNIIKSVLSTVSSSVLFTMGHSFHVDKERFMKLYDCFELYYVTMVFALYSICNFFTLPFMKLYTGGVNDINYIDPYLPLMFISTHLLSCGRIAPNQAINIAGHFKKTQYRSLLESAINLVVSIVAVNYLGIYGVLIGTIAALLYRTNDIILYTSKHILNRTSWITYKRWIINLAVFIGILFINRFLTFEMNSYLSIAIAFVPYALCTCVLFFGVSSLTEIGTAKDMLSLVSRRFRVKHHAG